MSAPAIAAAAADAILPRDDVPGILVHDLAKSYGKSRVLEVPDLAIAEGRLTAVVGGNGAGKSTLLGCLAGVLRFEGSVSYGSLAGGATERRPMRLAFLPQRLRLPGAATIDEIMVLFRDLAGSPSDRAPVPDDFLPPGNRRIGELSGGQAQRVALAATLLGAPDVLLLDEPYANLDDAAKAAAREMIVAHRDAGATICIASPAAFDLLVDADQVIQIEGGRVAFSGPASTYLADLRTTVWVMLEVGESEARFQAQPLVEQVRRAGRWAALDCHGRDVTPIVHGLVDLGIGPERIRVGGSRETSGSPSPVGDPGPAEGDER
ncbi:MAG: ABC transporter ATP-binding protein [Candidatus Limnocylindrales bacterium]